MPVILNRFYLISAILLFDVGTDKYHRAVQSILDKIYDECSIVYMLPEFLKPKPKLQNPGWVLSYPLQVLSNKSFDHIWTSFTMFQEERK